MRGQGPEWAGRAIEKKLMLKICVFCDVTLRKSEVLLLEAADSYKIFVHIYKTIRHHIPGDNLA
jgi:hypothetical protein